MLSEARPLCPDLSWWGYGGEHLRHCGVRLVDRLERFATSGLVETVRRLPRNAALLATTTDIIEREPPRVGVLVDYPDFHFLLGPALRRSGARVVYLLPPQVWAWRPGRVATMRGFVDAVAVGFPFEEALFRSAGLEATFIGHPLGLLRPFRDPPEPVLGSDPVVAFLPGSRPHEVERVLPILARAARILRTRHPGLRCRLGLSPAVPRDLYDDILDSSPEELFEPVDPPVGGSRATGASLALNGARAAVVGAGTATLEAALLAVPSVVVTRLSRITWELARRVVRVPHVAMPSILLDRPVFRERIQDELDPDRIARDVTGLLESERDRKQVLEDALELREMLLRDDTSRLFAGLLGG